MKKLKQLLLVFVIAIFGMVGVLSTLSTGTKALDDTPDCDSWAVIKCGIGTGEDRSKINLLKRYDDNDYGDIKAIYDLYSISREDIVSGTSSLVSGVIWRDGRVTLGAHGEGRTVLTQANTAIRYQKEYGHYPPDGVQYIAGSHEAYKSGASHMGDDQTAWIKLKADGSFDWAVIKSCGNPIGGVITPAPIAVCDALIVAPVAGRERTYTFTVKGHFSGGYSLVGYRFNFGDGQVKDQGHDTIEHTYAQYGSYTARGYIIVKLDGATKFVTSDNCAKPVNVAHPPVYSCDLLTATRIDRDTFRFTAKATAQYGAKIVSYTFNYGDGQKTTTKSDTATHTYAKAGTYTARLYVTFLVNGQTKTISGPKCVAKTSVAEQPIYTCDALDLKKLTDSTFRFTAKATAEHGATIKAYDFDFGDGVTRHTTSDQIEHTYKKEGTYKARVTVNFRVDGEIKKVTGPQCTVQVPVDFPEQPVYSCDALDFTQIDRDSFKFKAYATAKHGAKIVSYNFNFGDGTKVSGKSDTVTHNYSKAGKYTIRLSVTVKIGDKTKTVTSQNCIKTVKVSPIETPPSDYGCRSLTAAVISNDKHSFKYQLVYFADGNVILQKVDFDFGDGTTKTFAPDQLGDISHTYAKPGQYTTTATLSFMVGGNDGKVKTDDCEVQVNVPAPVCENNPNLPPESPMCNPCPYNPDLPLNSPDCELPSTGPTEVIGAALGIGSTTAAGYYWLQSRRDLSKLLNRR